MIEIILADKHTILRDGLRTLLSKVDGMMIVAEAGDGRTAVQLSRDHKPDVVLMGIDMPDMCGIDAAKRIIRSVPSVKIIALSIHSDRRFVLGMLEAGASGYLTKNCTFDELTVALRAVALGQTYISPSVSGVIVHGYLNKETSSALSDLTAREREVLKLYAEGMSTKQISRELGIGKKTVDTYRRNIFIKVKMSNVAELTMYAVREGLTSLS